MIPIDLSKQQIDFKGNLEKMQKIFFIIEEAKETILHFSQKLKILRIFFTLT